MPNTLENIPTPAIVLKLPIIRKNLARTAIYAKSHNLKVRPHFKTHKSRFFAGLQMEAGAIGITCAKVGEAETLGIMAKDLLLAYPALDDSRTQRLAQLAKSLPVHVAVDSQLAIDKLAAAALSASSTIGILIDLDVGFHRTGVQSIAAAVQLAQLAASTPGVRFDGIMIYPGHIGPAIPDQIPALQKIEHTLQELLALLKKSGLPTAIISGGSTPTNFQSHLIPSLTEIRPGTYIFNDRNTLAGNYCTLEDCAATILTTVVSNAVPNKLIIDAGSKTLTSDRLSTAPNPPTFGLVLQLPEVPLTRLSEEHGEIDITTIPNPPALGSRLNILPNHICPCINLQNSVWLQHEDQTLTPLPIDARGQVT